MSGLRLSAIIIYFLTVAGVSQARHCAVHDVSIRDDVLAGSAIMPTIEYETPYVVVGSGIPPALDMSSISVMPWLATRLR